VTTHPALVGSELLERIAALRSGLLVRARVAPAAGSLDVRFAGHLIGVARADIAALLVRGHPCCRVEGETLAIGADSPDRGHLDARLSEVAVLLRDAGVLRTWRNELLDVRPRDGGASLAAIERSACRALGIGTFAVHMNAFTADGALVVARRADNKAVDPGMWDNLVGGMVAAGESELEALARETHEEAGLELAVLPLERGSVIDEARPVREGYMVETMQVFDTVLPGDATPRNLDGEVAAIERRTVPCVLDAIERGEFTLESALVTLDGLERRALLRG
jgi:8-oxo-dGTP pyrophosphatase MutT (NUDIX family)